MEPTSAADQVDATFDYYEARDEADKARRAWRQMLGRQQRGHATQEQVDAKWAAYVVAEDKARTAKRAARGE